MELKVGMYVKTKHYGIKQIKKMDKISDEHIIYFTGNKYLEDYEISKSSFNIIDLIEVGDYVNGYLVIKVSGDYVFTNINDINFKNKDIKLVLTHQQYESNCYKIGE